VLYPTLMGPWTRLASLVATVAAFGVTAAGLVACGPQRDPGGAGDGGASSGADGGGFVPDGGASAEAGVDRGRARYAELCAGCHGDRGEGRTPNPPLDRWTRGRAALVEAIDLRMPPAAPALCAGPCAEEVAAYILGALQRGAPVSCDPGRRPPRQLRLLTRRAYVATVRALLGECRVQRFAYAPSGPAPASVLVSGSFNGWASTAAAGAWPMTRYGTTFVLARPLEDGRHQYKFIVDGRWVVDPSNPRRTPDGFGGDNSVLDVACAAEPDPTALTANFPPETRPPGYPFDDHAGSGAMTIVRLDEHWAAARSLAAGVAARLAGTHGCGVDRSACADRLLDALVRPAFRRTLTADERARYRAHALAGATAEAGVERLVRAVLVSPHFLYRSELGVFDAARGRASLSGEEVATALSFGLWGVGPDDALLAAAARGALASPAAVEATARRMLDDPRARPVLETFAEQWLGLERVLTADKRTESYPGYDSALRRALVGETSRLFAHVVLDSTHRLDELFVADYTFVDAAIARLYGLPPPPMGWARTSLASTPRRGILGHGSVLAAYAYSDQSSPVRRGVFVRERLLCQHLGTPPPNAGGLPEVDPRATTRERFAQHASDPACAGCHRAIDPIGFGFERFDALGRTRDTEAGRPIDARGDVVDLEALGAGTSAPFASLEALGRILSGSGAARRCFATQYLRFARGVVESGADLCAIEAVAARLEAGGDLRDAIAATYATPTFLERE
jgi:mono/diheme cytochrome c family protein